MKLWGNTIWPVWLGIVTLTFLVFEISALTTDSRNTLSDWVWRILKITRNEHVTAWNATDYLVFGTWIVLMSWLTFHFFLRKFT